MPDKKLTDAEIVKALKTLLELALVEGCLQRAKTISKALDLINRQQAENERLENRNKERWNIIEHLRNSVDTLSGCLVTAKAENEKLQEAIDEQDIEISRLYKRIDEAKAEAYKECIGKVKEYIDTHEHLSCEECECVPISKDGLDNLLKELVGDK